MQSSQTGKARVLIRQYGDLMLGAAFLVFFLAVIIFARDIRLLLDDAVSARFWPTVIGVVGSLLSVYLIAQGYRAGRAADAATPGGDDAPRAKGLENGNVRAVVTILLLFVYMLLMEQVGFLLMTILYMFLQITILTERSKRRHIKTIILSVVFSLVIYYFFRNLLFLMLPDGRLWSIFGR